MADNIKRSPKRLTVISGKGGTGKTSILGAFAALAHNAVLADCDVDAANLHLLLAPKTHKTEKFFAGYKAILDPGACTACGKCVEMCRFRAISMPDDSAPPIIDALVCEGCGVCHDICPADAIILEDAVCGDLYESETRFGPMVHAELGVGGEMSGKLVTAVRTRADEIAEKNGHGLVLIDGSPGLGCPVIASLAGVDVALIVAEPTVSGFHDLGRVLDLCKHFGLDACVVINKHDINPDVTSQITSCCSASKVEVAGEIPYDNAFTKAMLAGKTIIEYDAAPVADMVRDIWRRVAGLLGIEQE